MKLFAYAIRPFDELQYLDRYAREFGIEYGWREEYPSYENLQLAEGYDTIAIITNPMDKRMLDRMRELGIKYLITRSIGYEHIDVRYAYEIGMRVAHGAYSPNTVANYAIMMMLMACRKMPQIMQRTAAQDFRIEGNSGKELSVSTVGVIGTGNIGATLVRHLSGFGCRILMCDPYPKEELKAFGEYVGPDTLYRESDIITLHAPGMPENEHMINDETISRMKDGVILVNAARGSLVDTAALIRNLENGKIGFAALDTIENEGGIYYRNRSGDVIPHHERSILMSYPNVLLTPHMAFYTDQGTSDSMYNTCRSTALFGKGEANPLEVPHQFA